ncbi:MAG: DUF3090 family protein [Ferrimicrobium sp.]|uniref:DUF3090 family protein n=1 Tax=Ferrimicrobium sp. TaxID=2926050 RepID=UPI0026038153|nr:DUF3090 family protein [Ferrimicrobium sp.]
MSELIDFGSVTHFTVGTQGEPGHRVFLLQVGSGLFLLTVKVEKTQVLALVQGLTTALEELSRPHELSGDQSLLGDLTPAWAVGSIEIEVDATTELIEIELQELAAEGAESASARFIITREQAAQFAITATRLVEQGRPPCPLCGYPLDPQGHACPRTNGHRAPSL